MEIREAVVVSGARTPTGVFGGAFSEINTPQLGVVVVKAALSRAGISGEMVDEVIVGTNFQGGVRANSARQAAIASACRSKSPPGRPTKTAAPASGR